MYKEFKLRDTAAFRNHSGKLTSRVKSWCRLKCVTIEAQIELEPKAEIWKSFEAASEYYHRNR